MKKLNKILCPVDFSEISENTVKYAISFGKEFEVKPQILHVSTKPPEVYYPFFPDATAYLKAVEQDTKFQLKEFVQKRREAENKKRVEWLDGFSAEIQRKAKEKYDALKEAHPVKLKVKRSSRERPVDAKKEEKPLEKPDVVQTKPVAVSEPQVVPTFHVPKLRLTTPF